MRAALLLLLPGAVALPLPAGLAQQRVQQFFQPPIQQSASIAPAGANNYSVLMTAGADALVDRKYIQAATEFQRAADLDPQSAQAQYWAGQALIYGDKPIQAIYFLERAQQLGTDSVALHLALVAAYAGALRPADRNRESALLQAWHADGQHASLAHADGFLLETIFARPWHINVTQYFEPPNSESGSGQTTLWRFIVRDSAEIIEATYLLRADGPEHPFVLLHYSGEIALSDAAENRTSIVAASGGQPVKTYDKKPAYDQARSDVLQRVRSMSMLTRK